MTDNLDKFPKPLDYDNELKGGGRKMKIRVLKDMPFMKAGEVIELDDIVITNTIFKFYYKEKYLSKLIENGWIEEVKEEVKEKRLSDKVVPYVYKEHGYNGCNVVTQIARDHFLEVVDKAEDNYDGGEDCFSYIRKAIEGVK